MKTKHLFLTAIAATSLLLAGCSVEHSPKPDESTVEWSGKMLGIKTHSGYVKISEAKIVTNGDKVTGGKIVVDMTTITPTDANYAPEGSEQGTRAMLVGHLSSEDFFAVEKYPTATFEVTGTNEDGSVNGNLTIRGNTHPETVTNVVVGDGNISGTLVFDRKKYDVAWDSPMKDAVLSNDIELQVALKVAG